MTLLERVSALVRANLNDLMDRAEDPEVMIKQLILDLHNQYIQVKTQLAVSITEQHLTAQKAEDATAKAADWMRKAEMAVEKGQDTLAKGALERHNTLTQTGHLFAEQAADHTRQVALLRETLGKLEAKVREAEERRDRLVSQHRAAVARARAGQVAADLSGTGPSATMARMEEKVREAQAHGSALFDLSAEDLDSAFARMEREERLDRQLAEIKARKGLPAKTE